ncbi:DUF2059 domain-containing protein [Pseudoxanthomonas sp. UTMC 1351]|uniref:DUF2059 domain-containing protein n=1 Tax=Pseudoxanthomonas sp. UTMC 1351 TaxID=2695853 RepID=UPI0034CFE83A
MKIASLPARMLLTLVLVVIYAAAYAAEPSDADIDRLLRASRAQSLLNGVIPQLEAMQQQEFEKHFAGKELNAEQTAEVARIQTKTREIAQKALSWEEMRPLYVDAYKKTYTREEVRAIAKFYESTAGKSLLDKNPVLMQNLTAAIQQKMVPMLEELQTEIKSIPVAPAPAPAVSPPKKRRKK